MDVILAVNAGSSSLKFAVFERAGDDLARVAKGQVAWHDSKLALRVEGADGAVRDEAQPARDGADRFDPEQAMAALFAWVDRRAGGLGALAAVGHRVVHGGERFVQPVRVTEAVLAELDALVPLAPLHQPHNLHPIRVVQQHWPAVPQIACFDTAFHRRSHRWPGPSRCPDR